PEVSSGDLSGPGLSGVKVDINSAYAPQVSATYMITDNVSTELVLGLPYRHDMIGKGAIDGVGKIGDVQSLPPTLFLQYRFLEPKAAFRPYLGMGATYAYFRDARSTPTLDALLGPTSIKIDSKLALTAQIGATFAINERWFLDSTLTKTFLKTTATLTSPDAVRTIDTRLDPIAFSISVGYNF
ncbi:MAG: outer membrane beta-barrel protein, partial [Pseudomonadota bacterium]|nr:outer membrane beta-barrel protein [Pseudomonadota bacterium]